MFLLLHYIFIFLLISRKRFYSRKHQVPYQTRAMFLNNWKGYERCKQMNNFQFFNNKKNHKTVCELDSVHGRPFARSLDHSLTCTCANTFIFLPSHRFDCSVTISRYHDFNYIHIFFSLILVSEFMNGFHVIVLVWNVFVALSIKFLLPFHFVPFFCSFHFVSFLNLLIWPFKVERRTRKRTNKRVTSDGNSSSHMSIVLLCMYVCKCV